MSADNQPQTTTADLWSQLLLDASTTAKRPNLPSAIVVGDDLNGKRSLVARLQQKDFNDISEGFALEYTHVTLDQRILNSLGLDTDVFEDGIEFGLWQLEDRAYANLLDIPLSLSLLGSNNGVHTVNNTGSSNGTKPAVTTATATTTTASTTSISSKTVVVVTVDLSQPHQLVSSVNYWLSAVESSINNVIGASKNALLHKAMKQKVLDYIEDFAKQATIAETVLTLNDTPGTNRSASNTAGDSVSETYSEDAEKLATIVARGGKLSIEVNLGVPIIIVGCKSDTLHGIADDYSASLSSLIHSNTGVVRNDQIPTHYLNYIQYTLRKLCLKYGAALIYTSAMENKNCDLLLKYIIHWLHDSKPFSEPANIKNKESIFIPIGWDNALEINRLQFDSISADPEADSYEALIKQPTTKQTASHSEDVVVIESQEAFLQSQLTRNSRSTQKMATQPLVSAHVNVSRQTPELLKSVAKRPSPLKPTNSYTSLPTPPSLLQSHSSPALAGLPPLSPAAAMRIIDATGTPGTPTNSSFVSSSPSAAAAAANASPGDPASASDVNINAAESFFTQMMNRYKK